MTGIITSIGQALNGKHFVLDGINGTFKYETYTACYPYEHQVERILHCPTRKGAAYAAIRHQLGDDWDTDLTHSERLCDIAVAAGWQYTA